MSDYQIRLPDNYPKNILPQRKETEEKNILVEEAKPQRKEYPGFYLTQENTEE